MSESDPRVEGKAIVPFKTSEVQVAEDYERSEWTGTSTAIDKIGRALEDADTTDFVLPQGQDMDWIKTWVPKAVKTIDRNKGKFFERMEGRTGLETWAMPLNYANIDGSMGSGGADDMIRGDSDVHSRGIDIAVLIYDELAIHGRETIDELIRNIGAVEPQLITVVVNSMLKDKFLVPYTEPDGLKTLELVEAHTRNNMLGLTPTPAPELEDKQSDRKIGGTPDKPEDVVTTYQIEEDDVPIIDSAEEFHKKIKIKDSHFEE